MSLFGKKKEGQTILVLDIEQGSVAAALVRVSPGELPRLFGETRVLLPLLPSRDGRTLATQIEKATHEALLAVYTVAARLRAHPEAATLGTPDKAIAFMNAPWGIPNFSTGKPDYLPQMRDMLVAQLSAFAPELPLFFSTNADRTMASLQRLSPGGGVLLCMLGGEVTELLFAVESGSRGYATIPYGSASFLRTLKVHGSLSEAEARSLLLLIDAHASERYEPLDAAGRHFADQLANAGQSLLTEGGADRVIVVAQEPYGDWLAKILGGEESTALHSLFPEGASVTALRPHHFTPYIGTQASSPDIPLLLNALYVDRKFI